MRDDERRILAELERHARMTDPAFAVRMATPVKRRFPTVPALFALLYVSAPLIGLLFGLVVVACTTVAVFVVAAALMLRARQSRRAELGGD
jgi:Protein of unknown function (DUF3040)